VVENDSKEEQVMEAGQTRKEVAGHRENNHENQTAAFRGCRLNIGMPVALIILSL